MVRRHKNINADGNVFHIPQLPKRIMEKAVQALKENSYQEAKSLFAQLLEIDEEHGQAAYGLAICLMELGEYEPAEELTREMLQKDMGDYFEVFRLHITVLIQTNQYDKAAQMLEGILDEIDLPEETHDSYVQLLEFCHARQKDQQVPLSMTDEQSVQKQSFSAEQVRDMMAALTDAFPAERKWAAIHALNGLKAEETYEIVEPLLLKDNIDPFMKTLMLKTLAENGFIGEAEVRKFDVPYKISIHPDQEIFNPLIREVKMSIHNVLLSENPTLCQQAEDIWEHFSYASYPMDLTNGRPAQWAAACSEYVYELNGMSDELPAVFELYEVEPSECATQVQTIKMVEEDPSTLDFV